MKTGFFAIVIGGLLVWCMPAYAAYNPANIPTVATIAALQAGSFTNAPTVHVSGYHSAGDGNGGYFNLNGTSCSADGGSVVKDAAGNCFYRDFNGAMPNFGQFGAYGDNSHDDTATIQSAINYAAGLESAANTATSVACQAGNYKVTATIILSGTAYGVPRIIGQSSQVPSCEITPTSGIAPGVAVFQTTGTADWQLSGVIITCTGKSNGQIGVQIEGNRNVQFTGDQFNGCGVGIELYNTGGGFTEQFCMNGGELVNNTYGIEYYRATNDAASDSFARSGLGCGTPTFVTSNVSDVYVDDASGAGTAIVYGAPMNLVGFLAPNVFNVTGTTTPQSFFGNLSYEGNVTTFEPGSASAAVNFVGTITSLGQSPAPVFGSFTCDCATDAQGAFSHTTPGPVYSGSGAATLSNSDTKTMFAVGNQQAFLVTVNSTGASGNNGCSYIILGLTNTPTAIAIGSPSNVTVTISGSNVVLNNIASGPSQTFQYSWFQLM